MQQAQPSPEHPKFEANGEHQARLQLGSLDHLKETVDSNLAEFGESCYGVIVDETKGLQIALETVDASVGQGDLGTGQTTLEQAPRPRKLNEEVRDVLVELHKSERGEPTSDQRLRAMNVLLLDVTKEIIGLTDPNKGNLHYTDPQVQALKSVEAAFKQRHRNYFEDAQPEDDLLQNGEQRTPHEVADDAYDTLLAYIEDKLRDPSVPAAKAEELRIARDTLHLERKNWKEQFDAQNGAIDAVMQMMGRDNEQFIEARVRAAIRGSVGDELSRLQELVAIARDTSDPVERFNLLNGVQHERSPIQSAEAFDAWKQKRAEKAKATQEQDSAAMADDARKAIEAIISGKEQPTNKAEVSPSAATAPDHWEAKETLIVPIPTGWTELVHGTNSSRWQHPDDTVEVIGAGLSAISLEDIARGSGKTTDSYSRTRAKGGQPIEVRVLFYRADLSPRLGVRPDAAELKAGLSKDTLALIAKYHQDRHPLIPRGETLLKLGESVNPENGRQVEYYVPQSVAEQYVEIVKSETGRDIVLPKIEQSAQQVATLNEADQSRSATTETVPQATEQARNPYEQFVKSALARVPQNVLLESITKIAQDRLAASGEQVELNALRQQLGQRLSSGSLNIESAKLKALAKRIQQNGFYESSGGIWQAEVNPNTPQGKIAAEARNLVREIIADILANS